MLSAKDDDDLICPITQEYFRDPVIAEDGHLYEREAIIQWINQSGTSPLTRQVLNVNHLLPDDEVRRRADQRRNLPVKFKQQPIRVQPPRKTAVIPAPVRARRPDSRNYGHRSRKILVPMDRCCDYISETCERWFMAAFSKRK